MKSGQQRVRVCGESKKRWTQALHEVARRSQIDTHSEVTGVDIGDCEKPG